MASGHEPTSYAEVTNKVNGSVDDNVDRPGYTIVSFSIASSPGPLGEGRKGPGTHRLRMRWLYHVVAIIFPKKFTRVLRIFADHMATDGCAVESAREKPSTTTLPKADRA